jgi:hypothetical protein
MKIETNRWIDLFDSLRIIAPNRNIGSWVNFRTGKHRPEDVWKQEQLDEYESKISFRFPLGYKEYCQVFGSGVFGEYMTIYCPGNFVSEVLDMKNLRRNWELYQQGNLARGIVREDSQEIEDLIASAHMFGTNSSEHCVFWDKRSYGEADQSYDIYFVSGKTFFLVGRDFYSFITEFCLGLKSFDVLPKEYQPLKKWIKPTFQRAPSVKIWEDHEYKDDLISFSNRKIDSEDSSTQG